MIEIENSEYGKLMHLLGELSQGQKDIKDELVALNANVGDLWSHVRATQQDLLNHAAKCQLLERVRVLEQRAAGDTVAAKVQDRAEMEREHLEARAEAAREKIVQESHCTQNKWIEWVLKPILTALVLAIVALVLAHAGLFQAAVKP